MLYQTLSLTLIFLVSAFSILTLSEVELSIKIFHLKLDTRYSLMINPVRGSAQNNLGNKSIKKKNSHGTIIRHVLFNLKNN